MRILEVTHYMPPHMGGIERVAASLVDALTRRGHDVRWIASATPRPPESVDNLVRVPALNVLESRLGVPFPLWLPRAFPALVAQVRWADVVHVHDCLYMGSSAAALACRALSKPLLLTQHVGYVPFGAALDAVQRAAYATLGRVTLSLADRRVACSAHVPEYFASLGVGAPFELIANAIDEARFVVPDAAARAAARARWGVAPDARVALFVGRLVPKKGVARVAAAQRALAAEGVTLVVVGDGPQRALLDGVPGLVHHPEVAAERMPELYALADVFALPSRGEGLPLSVQEAMTAGLRAVVSDDPSYVANLSDAPGVTFAADDAALVAALRDALARPSPDPSVAAWARARWGRARFIDGYESALRDLARRRVA